MQGFHFMQLGVVKMSQKTDPCLRIFAHGLPEPLRTAWKLRGEGINIGEITILGPCSMGLGESGKIFIYCVE